MYLMEQDQFCAHDDPMIGDGVADVYFDVDMPWAELERFRGGWRQPEPDGDGAWWDYPCILIKTIIDFQLRGMFDRHVRTEKPCC